MIVHTKVVIHYNGENWIIHESVLFYDLAEFTELQFAEKYCKEKQWIIMGIYP